MKVEQDIIQERKRRWLYSYRTFIVLVLSKDDNVSYDCKFSINNSRL